MITNPDPHLINDDIRPVAMHERHWTVMSMASLWVGMVVCVPTYMLAAGLIDRRRLRCHRLQLHRRRCASQRCDADL